MKGSSPRVELRRPPLLKLSAVPAYFTFSEGVRDSLRRAGDRRIEAGESRTRVAVAAGIALLAVVAYSLL